MARPELGLKRHCPNCGTKYYDLNRNPITCPKCGTVYEEAVVTRVRPEAAAPRPVPAAAEEAEEDVAGVDAETDEPELVPLEDADEETVGAAKAVPGDDDIEIDEELGGDEEEFLEEEDEDDDVADLIEGDVEDEDEV